MTVIIFEETTNKRYCEDCETELQRTKTGFHATRCKPCQKNYMRKYFRNFQRAKRAKLRTEAKARVGTRAPQQ